MKEPIKSGDRCLVVNALGRNKSPNIGKEVIARSVQGEHSQYGRVWRCEGDLIQFDDMGGYKQMSWADIPAAWLEKINPDPLPPETTEEKKELTV